MSGRVRAGLVIAAVVVAVLAFVNFGLFFVNNTAPVPVFVSHPLGIVAMAYLVVTVALPSSLGRQGRNRVLPPPGPALVTYRCGGRIGWVRFSGRLIAVTVYTDRLTLRPLFMGEYTIHGSEIRTITDGGVLWRYLTIEHAAPGRTSPVLLASPPDDVRRAIARIRRDPVDMPPARPETGRGGWNVVTAMYTVGLVGAIALAGFGVVQLVRAPDLFSVAWLAIAVGAAYQCAREIVRQNRSG